ncbi:ABC transporter substrate-binding protein [Aminithiophilus ramosus]|uniref:ABC transporter substrate-binding protein n=1 Tax=Aminithiophilus ramosus TaxID=3029084 RepID=A0A9Q7A944_9BACT|nr:ABC transporter substrate-binding protein [Aminithiophilus ramosus]QTX31188.1 ABC transporter substrate-binding protein [Aminithiophilus ramosus]
MFKAMKQLLLGIVLILGASALLLVSDYRGRAWNRSARDGEPAAALQGKVRAGEILHLAVLKWATSVTNDETHEGLMAGLSERGFDAKRGIVFHPFSAEGDMPTALSVAQNACGGEYDLVLSISTPMLQVTARANEAGKVPHVFGAVTDPYAAGVGISDSDHREHPAWLAGVGTFQPVREAIELIARLRPEVKRLGTVMNPSEACSQACFTLAKETCEKRGIMLSRVTVDNSSAVYEAASALASQGIEAFIIGGDNTVESAFDSVIRAANGAGIPVIGYASPYAEKGALIGLGADYFEVGRIQGHLTADILEGLSPADIPVENVMPLKCSLNKNVLANLRETWIIPSDVEAEAAEVIGGQATQAVSSRRSGTFLPVTSARRWKLHFLNYVDSTPTEDTLRGFREVLQDAGWVEGKDYSLSVTNAQGDMPTLSTMIDNALSQNSDLLLLTSTPTLQAAVQKVRQVPVIFGVVANPVIAGAGRSDADHLPNVTGISSASAYGEGVAALLACLPDAKRVGTLVNPSESNCVYNLERLTEELAARGISCLSVPVSTPMEMSDAIRSLLSMGVDAVLQVAGNLFFSSFAPISKACLEARVPLFGFDSATATEGGAVLAVARDYRAGGEDMGRLALRILQGEKPADLPFAPISKTIVTINEANARRYNLTIPLSLRQGAQIVSDEGREERTDSAH